MTDVTGNFFSYNNTTRTLSANGEEVPLPNNHITSKTTPVTGATVTAADDESFMYLTPAGTLATLTIALPPKASLQNGQEFAVQSTQIVTAVTFTATGTTITGAPSALAVGTTVRFKYLLAITTWIVI